MVFRCDRISPTRVDAIDFNSPINLGSLPYIESLESTESKYHPHNKIKLPICVYLSVYTFKYFCKFSMKIWDLYFPLIIISIKDIKYVKNTFYQF